MELVKTIADGLEQEEGLVFFPEDCETIAVNCVHVKQGQITEPAVHPDEEEVYVITGGEGIVYLDKVPNAVVPGKIVYIPRHVEHIIEGVGPDGVTYVCVANWPDLPAKKSMIKE